MRLDPLVRTVAAHCTASGGSMLSATHIARQESDSGYGKIRATTLPAHDWLPHDDLRLSYSTGMSDRQPSTSELQRERFFSRLWRELLRPPVFVEWESGDEYLYMQAWKIADLEGPIFMPPPVQDAA